MSSNIEKQTSNTVTVAHSARISTTHADIRQALSQNNQQNSNKNLT